MPFERDTGVGGRMTRRGFVGAGVAAVAVGADARTKPADGGTWPAARAAAVARRIQPPNIPRREFAVVDFGGAGDGATDNSAAIARAIAACAAAGGGRIVLPPGTCLTGPIRLRSRIALHVPRGTRLKFLPEPDRYLPPVFTRWEGVELMGYHPLIYAFEERDVAITGGGIIDGGADDRTWWPWKGPWAGRYRDIPLAERQVADRTRLFELAERGTPPHDRVFGAGSRLRPPLFQPYRCDNVMVSDVTITGAPFWLLHPVLCRNVLIRGVTCSSHGPNNDGIDPESCSDVLIEDCVIDTGDDCIALKSGRNADGRRIARPCENVVVRRCQMKDGHAGIAIGSEVSGGVRNVFVHDCVMSSPHLTRALVVKTNSYRGAIVEDIFLHRITIGVVERAVAQLWMHYEEGDGGRFVPMIRRISLSNITVQATERTLLIRGRSDSRIADVRLTDVVVRQERARSIVIDAVDVSLTRVAIGGVALTVADLPGLPGLDAINCDRWAVCRTKPAPDPAASTRSM